MYVPCAQPPRTAYCVAVAVASSSKRPSEPTHCRHRLQQHRTGEEYTNVSDQVLFSPFSGLDFSNTHPLASTPNADFCVSDSNDAIYWLSAFNVRVMHTLLPRSYTRSLIPTRSPIPSLEPYPQPTPTPTPAPVPPPPHPHLHAIGADFCCISRSAAASSVPRCTRNGQGDVDGSGLFCDGEWFDQVRGRARRGRLRGNYQRGDETVE